MIFDTNTLELHLTVDVVKAATRFAHNAPNVQWQPRMSLLLRYRQPVSSILHEVRAVSCSVPLHLRGENS